MKKAGFILGELLVAGLLAVGLFISLLFQPAWIWALASIVMIAAFVLIPFWKDNRPTGTLLLVLLCPLSYVGYLLALGLSTPNQGIFLTVAGYYVGGVILLGAHYLLNAKLR